MVLFAQTDWYVPLHLQFDKPKIKNFTKFIWTGLQNLFIWDSNFGNLPQWFSNFHKARLYQAVHRWPWSYFGIKFAKDLAGKEEKSSCLTTRPHKSNKSMHLSFQWNMEESLAATSTLLTPLGKNRKIRSDENRLKTPSLCLVSLIRGLLNFLDANRKIRSDENRLKTPKNTSKQACVWWSRALQLSIYPAIYLPWLLHLPGFVSLFLRCPEIYWRRPIWKVGFPWAR